MLRRLLLLGDEEEEVGSDWVDLVHGRRIDAVSKQRLRQSGFFCVPWRPRSATIESNYAFEAFARLDTNSHGQATYKNALLHT